MRGRGRQASLQSSRSGKVLVAALPIAIPVAVAGLLGASYIAFALPPVPTPPQNPTTEVKRLLGKMLFWDEQLSTSNVVACATCHVPRNGGTDPRLARNPGPDAVLNTPDDRLASPGIIASDGDNDYVRDVIFGVAPQITERSAPTMINAAYAPLLFWDGRASGEFRDPLDNSVLIPTGGALESQAIQPLLNSVEMAHEGFSWSELSERIDGIEPLALATSLPTDVAAARATHGTYGALFQQAFGDTAITPARIAMAIAAYQRTLISDQSPFDRFRAGQANALTPQQQQGFQQFQIHNCNACHSITSDLFTDFSFRNIGLRPIAEDSGRQAITGNVADRGKFKVPSLRNVALKRSFMHNGQFQTLPQVLGFYAGATPNFPDNRDPAMATIGPLPPNQAQLIVDFLSSLTDPRVAAGTAPFDGPVLFADRPGDRATLLGGASAGTGGLSPQIIAQGPAMIGVVDYRIGLANALGGATARLAASRVPPVNGRVTPQWYLADEVTTGTGSGVGMATHHWALSTFNVQPGEQIFVQWQVTDPAAAAGVAFSPVARIPILCSSSGCPCDSIDFNRDGLFPDDADLAQFLGVFAGLPCPPRSDASLPQCDIDFNNDGLFPDDADLLAFLNVAAGGGC